MPKVLIITNTNLASDPRPYRMVNYFKNKNYEVTTVGYGMEGISGVEHIPIVSLKRQSWFSKIKFVIARLLNHFESMTWTSELNRLGFKLLKQDFNLIICQAILLLPLSIKVKNNAKILFDAREFYPENFSDQKLWSWLIRPLNQYLCKKYLSLSDKIITVSEGLAGRYLEDYNVQAEVFMGLPNFQSLEPQPLNKQAIKIIYHGRANKSRHIEEMIKMMDHVDVRFSLDMLLVDVPLQKRYLKKLVSMINKRKNIRILEPIPMQELVTKTNQYDIGLFLCPPTNFNLKHALPNKFFEYIQARLAVAIGPSIEMERIVKKYDCGIVSESFNPKSLAQELNKLTVEKIMYYKSQSHKAALELSAENNNLRLDLIVGELLNK